MTLSETVCPACGATVALRMSHGHPAGGLCACGLVLRWDGDCHVSWDGAVASDIIRRRNAVLTIPLGPEDDHGC